jgi:adapter protein MecA 1/2
MKIEKLNDNQVKCILTREDLAQRKLKLSELVYGSEKAKLLFRDMLQLAAEECDFDGEDMPIMVEAIPTAQGQLVLILTRVENPDELDARFSHLTPFNDEEEEVEENGEEQVFSGLNLDQFGEEAKDVLLNFVDKIKNMADSGELRIDELGTAHFGNSEAGVGAKNGAHFTVPTCVSIEFDSLEQIAAFAHVAAADFRGNSRLYKDSGTGEYYLLLDIGRELYDNYRRICNIACEYGRQAPYFSKVYLEEHFEKIIASDAIGVIANMM